MDLDAILAKVEEDERKYELTMDIDGDLGHHGGSGVTRGVSGSATASPKDKKEEGSPSTLHLGIKARMHHGDGDVVHPPGVVDSVMANAPRDGISDGPAEGDDENEEDGRGDGHALARDGDGEDFYDEDDLFPNEFDDDEGYNDPYDDDRDDREAYF